MYIPWNKPGYLIGPHPLVLAYLSDRPHDFPITFPSSYEIDSLQTLIGSLKWSLLNGVNKYCSMKNTRLMFDSIREFYSNRNDLNLTELFADPPDLVFHHAAIYPTSVNFIQHYENPISLFYPFLWFGQVEKDFNLRETPLFEITKEILESDDCKILFSHMDCCVNNLNDIFNSSKIKNKNITIRPTINLINKRPRRYVKRVMFSNSFNSSDSRFYLRGGLAALKCFLSLSSLYPDVEFILFSNVPVSVGQDVRCKIEQVDNIKIIKQGLSEESMNELCASIDVLVNPSTGLHSMTVLRAMSAGSLVITSDVFGYNEYINDGVNGLMLSGVSDLINTRSELSGLVLEHYPDLIGFNEFMEVKLFQQLSKVLDDHEAFFDVRSNAIDFINRNFSSDRSSPKLWDFITKASK